MASDVPGFDYLQRDGDALRSMLQQLDAKSLARLAQVARWLRDAARDDALWRNLLCGTRLAPQPASPPRLPVLHVFI